MRGEERRREGRGGEERDKRPKSLEKNEQYWQLSVTIMTDIIPIQGHQR
jgi:hypothetical protein